MPNTFSQLYVHVVFAVKGRASLISAHWKEKLYQYITGIIRNKNQKLMIINGMPDHLHILIGYKPDYNLSDLVRDIKSNSSKWINENHFIKGNFAWQTGFGAFTVSPSQVQFVVQYILNQENHHRKESFRDEYIAFLKTSGIDFNADYLPDDFGAAPTGLNDEN